MLARIFDRPRDESRYLRGGNHRDPTMTSFWTAIARRLGPVTSTRWFALALSFAIPGTALLIYLLLGSPLTVQPLPEPAQASPSNPQSTSSAKEVESRAAELA